MRRVKHQKVMLRNGLWEWRKPNELQLKTVSSPAHKARDTMTVMWRELFWNLVTKSYFATWVKEEYQESLGPTRNRQCMWLKNKSMTALFTKCVQKEVAVVCTLHGNLLHLVNYLILSVAKQSLEKAPTKDRQKNNSQIAKHGQREPLKSSDPCYSVHNTG